MTTRKKILLGVPGILLLSTVIAVLVSYSFYQRAVYDGYGEPTTSVEFSIEEGETVEQITQRLKAAGLIENEWYFKIYIRQADLSDKLQAGDFTIPDNLSLRDLANLLQHAEFPDIWVTIPEGMMATDIADKLAGAFATYPQAAFDKTSFLALVDAGRTSVNVDMPIPDGKSLEGYLFPDTYRFPPDATAEYVLTTMVETLKIKAYDPNIDDITASSYSFYELLTLASILERETRSAADRPLVADILLRRIEHGWKLECDVTLLYYFGDWNHEITHEELQLDTPYNTRKNPGLPPTPITNPGTQTFEAMLAPESNDYWFFLSDSDGILHYAKTMAEHSQNIARYL